MREQQELVHGVWGLQGPISPDRARGLGGPGHRSSLPMSLWRLGESPTGRAHKPIGPGQACQRAESSRARTGHEAKPETSGRKAGLARADSAQAEPAAWLGSRGWVSLRRLPSQR